MGFYRDRRVRVVEHDGAKRETAWPRWPHPSLFVGRIEMKALGEGGYEIVHTSLCKGTAKSQEPRRAPRVLLGGDGGRLPSCDKAAMSGAR